MPTRLNAAQRSHRRKELIEDATDAMSDSRPDDIVAILVRAEKARPTYNPEPLRPEVRDAVLAANAEFAALIQRFKENQSHGPMIVLPTEREDEASPEWTRKKLSETFTRRTNLDVYADAFLTPAAPLTVTRVTGHGIQRPEQIPSLHGVRPWAGAR